MSLTATGAATVSLTGSALAVNSTDTCEDDPFYGTMTEEIYGDTWQQNVVALAIENSEMDLTTNDVSGEALIVRAVFGGSIASQRKDNSNFTFTIVDDGNTYINVASGTGVVTPVSGGKAYVEVTLTNYPNVPPAYAEVTVTNPM